MTIDPSTAPTPTDPSPASKRSPATGSPGNWLGLGAVLAAIGASICCVVPVVVAIAGIGSAAFSVHFEPVRPYLIGATVLLLGFAFHRAYRPEEACEPDEACAIPANRRRQRILLWVITLLAIALLAFPHYVGYIL